jgi:hypothetical protein
VFALCRAHHMHNNNQCQDTCLPTVRHNTAYAALTCFTSLHTPHRLSANRFNSLLLFLYFPASPSIGVTGALGFSTHIPYFPFLSFTYKHACFSSSVALSRHLISHHARRASEYGQKGAIDATHFVRVAATVTYGCCL